jgi:DNA-binding beta-propeller fold protein YncE
MGIAVDASNTVYVVDEEANTIRKITPAGQVTTLAGRPGTKHESQDGLGAAARFYHPVGLAVDAGGTLYVTDADNHTIRKITPQGDVTTLAGLAGHKGHLDGGPGTAQFNLPHGVAVAANGTVYVADTDNHTIRKITPAPGCPRHRHCRQCRWRGHPGAVFAPFGHCCRC